MSPSMEACIAEYATLPTPPLPTPSPLSPWLSLLPQIPSPPLPPPTADSPTYANASLDHQSDRIEEFLEDELPPRKGYFYCSYIEIPDVWESSTAAPRLTGGHRVDYRRQDTQDIYAVIEDTQTGRLGHLATALGQIQALQARDQTHAGDREGAGSSA
ncbi:hypothetical protein Tco_1455674 [Tanacetum coccineum]